MTPFDQLRIAQLTSAYSPMSPPSLPLDFGDYLSLLWLLDQAGKVQVGINYFRKCERALANALGITDTSLGHLVKITPPGAIIDNIPHLSYRKTERRIDALDRRHATAQLLQIRSDVMRLGSYVRTWDVSWPGSRITDEELRDRVYAVLFAAMPSQFDAFARILLVLDIVLQELLIETRRGDSFLLFTLVTKYGWPDPETPETEQLFRHE